MTCSAGSCHPANILLDAMLNIAASQNSYLPWLGHCFWRDGVNFGTKGSI